MARLVLWALALLVAGGASDPVEPNVTPPKIADSVFLKKQVDLLTLYFHVNEPLQDPELKAIADSWDLESNIERYSNVTAVKVFTSLKNYDMLLPRSVPFLILEPTHQFEAVTLFNLFLSAKDYDTFYKTAVYLRDFVNEGLFVYVLAVATVHHPETQGIIVPPLYDVFPSYYHNGEIMNIAHRVNTHGKRLIEHYPQTFVWDDNVVIRWNTTIWPYLENSDIVTSYYSQDYALNTLYYNNHVTYPFWLSGKNGPLRKYKRGEYVWFFHKQLLNRYYMERLSNGLSEVPELGFDVVEDGFTSGLVYQNGIPFPARPNNLHVNHPMYLEIVDQIKTYIRRIKDAIDLGYVVSSSGEHINLRTPDAINVIGNVIEGNVDSPNLNFYGSLINSWKLLLGNAITNGNMYSKQHVPLVVPSALENYQTSMWDPAFYMIWKQAFKLFSLWSSYLPEYTHEELALPTVKIKKVEADKLVTYFEYKYLNVTNALYLNSDESKVVADDISVLVQRPQLTNKVFTIRVHVKNDVAKKVVVRFFLAPKYDSNGYEIPLHLNTENIFQLDQFVYQLPVGEHVIKRESTGNIYTIDQWYSSYEVYQKALDALNGKGQFVVDGKQFFDGYPRRLMLPKGRVGGMPFQLIVFISDYVAPETPYGKGVNPEQTFGIGTGARRMTAYPLDYPFDRPLHQYQIENLSNVLVQDVLIYHKPTPEIYAQLPLGLTTMKTVLVLASLVALAFAGSFEVPPQSPKVYKEKSVDNEFVSKQMEILKLLYHSGQLNPDAEYYKIGKDYDIEAHINNYSNQKAVEEFLDLWKVGFLPKNIPFSIFNEKSKQEAIALFHVLYYAKDFDTFYKTAAFARIYLNEGQFVYAYYIAVLHRADTKGVVLPAPYEAYPELFTNVDVWYKINRVKMEKGINDVEFGREYGIVQESDKYVFYANYSDYFTYPGDEHKISYFTEDIGLNAYYYYFHAFFPFWLEGDVQSVLKEHRGEIYYYFYQQLLARYYLERLTNGIGEIKELSWNSKIETGYRPMMRYYNNFVQRPQYYQIPYESHVKELQALQAYENSFIEKLLQGHVKFFNQDVDFHNSKSVNFVGNFWQTNADLYSKVGPWKQSYSYEGVARYVLGGAPESFDKYNFVPAALDFYQTSLRDPVFYQLYSKILKYFIDFKKSLTPYTQDVLHYVGVKINDVKVEKLVTYFDYYDFEVTNTVALNQEEVKSNKFPYYVVRQPRLNHKPFTVSVDVKSDVDGDAVFKIFLGPKYNSQGYPISLEDNWMNFVELDWFVQKLNKGQNKIERKSSEFYYVKEDSAPVREVLKMLGEGKVPVDMSVKPGAFPQRLVLPKGNKGGYPLQIFVVAYPYQQSDKQVDAIKVFGNDNKPLGYPLDRPVNEVYFKQPNMFFKDVSVYHEGELYSYEYNVPYYTIHHNEVNKH
ncbi:uncharacterized protein LOC119839897 [Zerene cesonia]|uniref:uncharacterized protein LOC119839897 n=1 Tax=Zerene cesonia TaxID=33412 RepID=UPI0018E58C87|nr:uncharacterized protein LOC119839897 [Zerene cesonia]